MVVVVVAVRTSTRQNYQDYPHQQLPVSESEDPTNLAKRSDSPNQVIRTAVG